MQLTPCRFGRHQYALILETKPSGQSANPIGSLPISEHALTFLHYSLYFTLRYI